MVGVHAYFYNDEFIGVSFQPGRKCPKTFDWKDKASYHKVFAHVVTMIKLPNLVEKEDLVDMEFELDKYK